MNRKGEGGEIFASVIVIAFLGLFLYAMTTSSSDNAFTETFCQDNGYEGFRDEPTLSCFKNEGTQIIYQKIDCVAYGFYPEERIRRCTIMIYEGE